MVIGQYKLHLECVKLKTNNGSNENPFLIFLFSPQSALFNLTLMEHKAIAEKYKRKLVKCFDCWADIRGDYHKQVIRAQHSMSEEVRIFCKKCYKVIARLIKSRMICKMFYFATLLFY